MISYIFFIRGQTQRPFQADLSFAEQSSLDVKNTEVVLTLHMVGFYLQYPDRQVAYYNE